MSTSGDQNPAPAYPRITEEQWYTLAIVSGVFTLILTLLAAVWIFGEPSLSRRVKMISSIGPFGAVPVAITTFCTVAWRGLVGTRQADQQQRQNDASEDANFAKLLQEGAKMIADSSPANQMAGVASLNIILSEPKARFAIEARDILAEVFKGYFAPPHDNPSVILDQTTVFSSISTLLAQEAKAGRFSKVDMSIEETAFSESGIAWPIIAGFSFLYVKGGSFHYNNPNVISLNKHTSFEKVAFWGANLEIDLDFVACSFNRCTIRKLDIIDVGVGLHSFSNCDFSGCFGYNYSEYDLSEHIRFVDCWFDVENAPDVEDLNNLTLFLQPRIKLEGSWKRLNQVSLNDDLTDTQRALIKLYDR
ncbi:hypothetical protein RHIZ_07550 [Rhizobium skierniewicense]|uniref:hypothetical protein n=1 Tax=Rhizobium skierniewicense TaxID=984260 RepID=UPI001FABCA53|nr:hypothetical protein [Rhizobium skierniewicense]MCI9865792.1 hypothetical protein [Rhizobium skierniewicense]